MLSFHQTAKELDSRLFTQCEDCSRPYFKYQHAQFMKKIHPESTELDSYSGRTFFKLPDYLNEYLLREQAACADWGCCYKTACHDCRIQCDGCGEKQKGEYMLFIDTPGFVTEKQCDTCVQKYMEQYSLSDIDFFTEFVTHTYDREASYTVDFVFPHKKCGYECGVCGAIGMNRLLVQTPHCDDEYVCDGCMKPFVEAHSLSDIPLFHNFLQGTMVSETYIYENTIYSNPHCKTTFHHTGNGICTWHGISEYLHNKRGW